MQIWHVCMFSLQNMDCVHLLFIECNCVSTPQVVKKILHYNPDKTHTEKRKIYDTKQGNVILPTEESFSKAKDFMELPVTLR